MVGVVFCFASVLCVKICVCYSSNVKINATLVIMRLCVRSLISCYSHAVLPTDNTWGFIWHQFLLIFFTVGTTPVRGLTLKENLNWICIFDIKIRITANYIFVDLIELIITINNKFNIMWYDQTKFTLQWDCFLSNN